MSVTPWQDAATRRTLREAARASNLLMQFATGAAADALYLATRSKDPFPKIPPALLNSADIADYVAATGMIEPFDPARLKSASYEVALLGPYFYIDGAGKKIEGDLARGDKVRIPQNTIAFMSVEPYFRLPDYIALRHNLKIDHIYKGLLVGTGPLIDPGFVGRIALPLHNLTERDYEFTGGEGIIWVEFTKLSPNPSWSTVKPATTQAGSYVNFPAERTISKTVRDYVKDAVGLEGAPASSSAAIARTAINAKQMSKRTRGLFRVGSAGIGVAIVALVLTLGGYMLGLYQQVADLKVEIIKLQVNSTSQPAPSSTASPTPIVPAPTPTP